MPTRMPPPATTLASARNRVIAAAENAPTAQALFASVSAELNRIVPSHASGWFGVDPQSLLPSWPARVERIPAGHCETYWEREFFEDDVLLVRDLAISPFGTGALRHELGDLVNRSARYRQFIEPQGFNDELRSTLRSGGSTWGVMVLLRFPELPPFTFDELQFIESLSEPLAECLRTKALAVHRTGSDDRGHGVLTYDVDGHLLAANEDALFWLDQLPNSQIEEAAPLAVSAALAHARAVEAGRARGAASTLLPSRSGQWLTVNASALRGPAGEARAFAVTVGPSARRELAPFLAEEYGLSRREVEVTQRLARGDSTATIAEQLFLSEHTVRDHVKATLNKTGVSSRAELVSHLFFEHVHSTADSDLVHV